MSIFVHKLLAGGHLAAVSAEIDRVVERTEREVCPLLALPDVDLVFHVGKRVIPELGITGYCPGANQAVVVLNPENKQFLDRFENKLLSIIAHELHHCSRTSQNARGVTLHDHIVLEGLACHFEAEVVGAPPFYATTLFDVEVARLMPQLREEMDSSNYDHGKWFYGTQPSIVPPYAGYSLGYTIVTRHMKRLGLLASQLTGTPASDFGSAL